MNVTGIEFGNLESGAPSMGGGTNLPIEFLTQVDDLIVELEKVQLLPRRK